MLLKHYRPKGKLGKAQKLKSSKNLIEHKKKHKSLQKRYKMPGKH